MELALCCQDRTSNSPRGDRNDTRPYWNPQISPAPNNNFRRWFGSTPIALDDFLLGVQKSNGASCGSWSTGLIKPSLAIFRLRLTEDPVTRAIHTAIWALLCLSLQSHGQEPLDVIKVVGRTPLGGGIEAGKFASNVQSATAADISKQRALDLADFMKRNFASVFVNEAQSNPLQPDVQYRGFVGSPLLGLPQGIAVYQDGVRINEPFGDTVNWALIPDSAIKTVHLMPGSNPMFGLNALGGAIAIETKDGFSNAGRSAKLYGGSFGRVGLQAEVGDSARDNFAYFLTGSYLEEDGWRDFSPTNALQLFGNLGWRLSATTLDLNLTLADTDLIGNGAVPIQLLQMDREAILTRPDQTKNELFLVNLIAEHKVSDTLTVTGNVHVRSSEIGTYNGDGSEFEECADSPGFLCETEDDEEELILDQSNNPIPAIEEVADAAVNRTNTDQDSFGVGLQLEWTAKLGGRDNVFVLGTSYADSSVDFDVSTELGKLDATRLAIPSGIFVSESFTELSAGTTSLGVYFSNTLALSDAVSLTLSGRHNDIDVTLRDQLGTALDGDHSFDRFNLAVGFSAALSDDVNLYFGYSESNRAPSPVELTCADEDDPCRLPNAFLADPPLEQVVAGTFEAGLRGKWSAGNWHAGLFSTTNKDDILFISAGSFTNQGFFDNVGRTRRNGLELSISGVLSKSVDWFVNYTYLDATFRESLSLSSPNNPAAIDGEVFAQPGDRLPLIPNQLFKAGIHAPLGNRITIGADLLAGGDFYMRGDEGNDLARIGEFAVLNVRGDYQALENLRIFVNIDNVLDEEYETFGLFGEAETVLGDEFQDNRFFSPAAPRAAWLGVQVTF